MNNALSRPHVLSASVIHSPSKIAIDALKTFHQNRMPLEDMDRVLTLKIIVEPSSALLNYSTLVKCRQFITMHTYLLLNRPGLVIPAFGALFSNLGV